MNKSRIPFVEKYRPKNLEDVLGGHKILFDLVSNDFSKHLLLFGPPGTGKSTVVQALLKNVPSDSILNMNAKIRSNTTISLIKKMTSFSSKKTTFHKKFILVDEVDTIPIHDQKIFIRPLESDITKNTRQNNLVFIFICNRINYVSEFIKKNCIIIKYNRLAFNECKYHLRTICNAENIEISDNVLEFIYSEVNCDLRKTISTIEFLFCMNHKITKNIFKEFHRKIDTKYFESIETYLTQNPLKNVVDFLHDDINSVKQFCIELLKFHKKHKCLSSSYTQLLAEMCVDSQTTTNTWFIIYRLLKESPYFSTLL